MTTEKGCQAWTCPNVGVRWVKDRIAERWSWLFGPCYDRQKAAVSTRGRPAPQQPLANQLTLFEANHKEDG